MRTLASAQAELAALRGGAQPTEGRSREVHDADLCAEIREIAMAQPWRSEPCPHGCGYTGDHHDAKGKKMPMLPPHERAVTEGASLCPQVRKTRRKGQEGKREDKYGYYFRAPWPWEVAKWDEKLEAEERAERKANIRASQTTVLGS